MIRNIAFVYFTFQFPNPYAKEGFCSMTILLPTDQDNCSYTTIVCLSYDKNYCEISGLDLMVGPSILSIIFFHNSTDTVSIKCAGSGTVRRATIPYQLHQNSVSAQDLHSC